MSWIKTADRKWLMDTAQRETGVLYKRIRESVIAVGKNKEKEINRKRTGF